VRFNQIEQEILILESTQESKDKVNYAIFAKFHSTEEAEPHFLTTQHRANDFPTDLLARMAGAPVFCDFGQTVSSPKSTQLRRKGRRRTVFARRAGAREYRGRCGDSLNSALLPSALKRGRTFWDRRWRSEWDSNPRYGFSVHPSDRLLAPSFQLSQHRF
jgi:hypothetical protein